MSPGSPGPQLDGRGPLTPERPRSLLRAQALRPCVLCGCVCSTRTSRQVQAFTLLSCSVMSCRLPLTLQGGCGERAAADQTGRVRPLHSFPPRLSAQTHHHPLRPRLAWRSARSVHGVSRVPPALPLLGGGCCEPPDPQAPLLPVPCEDLQTPPGPGFSGRRAAALRWTSLPGRMGGAAARGAGRVGSALRC